MEREVYKVNFDELRESVLDGFKKLGNFVNQNYESWMESASDDDKSNLTLAVLVLCSEAAVALYAANDQGEIVVDENHKYYDVVDTVAPLYEELIDTADKADYSAKDRVLDAILG